MKFSYVMSSVVSNPIPRRGESTAMTSKVPATFSEGRKASALSILTRKRKSKSWLNFDLSPKRAAFRPNDCPRRE